MITEPYTIDNPTSAVLFCPQHAVAVAQACSHSLLAADDCKLRARNEQAGWRTIVP